jgi:transposase
MQTVVTVGLDIAKNVFQAHGVDAEGGIMFRKRITRAKVLDFFARLPACLGSNDKPGFAITSLRCGHAQSKAHGP